MYTYAQKLIAARGRYKEGMTQAEAAKLIGAARESVNNWETGEDEDWQKATERVIREMLSEGVPVAMRCLLRTAEGNDVQAAKTLLDRGLGAVSQTLGLHGVADKPPVGLAWMEAVKEGQSKREAVQEAEETDGSPAAGE